MQIKYKWLLRSDDGYLVRMTTFIFSNCEATSSAEGEGGKSLGSWERDVSVIFLMNKRINIQRRSNRIARQCQGLIFSLCHASIDQ